MKCQATMCPNRATHIYIWQSDRMAAPSFWYGCEHETADWLSKGKRVGLKARVEKIK